VKEKELGERRSTRGLHVEKPVPDAMDLELLRRRNVDTAVWS
jgi:hypothetical protein